MLLCKLWNLNKRKHCSSKFTPIDLVLQFCEMAINFLNILHTWNIGWNYILIPETSVEKWTYIYISKYIYKLIYQEPKNDILNTLMEDANQDFISQFLWKSALVQLQFFYSYLYTVKHFKIYDRSPWKKFDLQIWIMNSLLSTYNSTSIFGKHK